MQGLLPPLAVVAAPRGLAVDGHKVGLGRPALGHPRRKAGREQLRIDPVHDRPQPIGARDAVVKLTETPQERQVSLPPIDDVVIVIAAGNRAAYHQEQNFPQRIGDFPRLPRILDHRQVVEQQPQPRLGRKRFRLHRPLPNRKDQQNQLRQTSERAQPLKSSQKRR